MLQQHEWDLATRTLTVAVPVRVVWRGLRPEPAPLLGVRLSGPDLYARSPYLHLGVWLSAEVVQRCRMAGMPALRSDERQTVALGHVDQRRCAELPALGADAIEQQQRRGVRADAHRCDRPSPDGPRSSPLAR